MVEVVAPIMSACHLQSRLVRLSKICQDRMVLLLVSTSLLEDQMACRTYSKVREMQATNVEAGGEVGGTMETVDLADIGAVPPRTEYLEHQYAPARRK